eukprot:TRINITY_DN2231_c0_g1_i1.p1 TRINITY_DN2231_c0_g1~~TRINITY_DN2231_c0_g1_i1.p1  ORF type:complete len:440 (-),score=242.25 TRINITY_DN2231_c0_g1_i1:74-1393(-)
MAARDRASIDELEEEEEESLRNPEVVTFYETSAQIANNALIVVARACKPGRKIVDLCQMGDDYIEQELKKLFPKLKIDRGIAFPTSISVNNCAGHFSPLSSDTTVLAEGDLAKIDLGVHIDGFIATLAHSIIVSREVLTIPISGRRADVICAAHFAAECAHKLMRPGRTNSEVTEAIRLVAQTFHCNPLEGVLSHEMSRYVIDGQKSIINKETQDQRVEQFTFRENEVYAVDIVMSTGEGKTHESDVRTTIFKRIVDNVYMVKLKTARYVLSEINSKFPATPFTIRALDERKAKLGITELIKHDLIQPYPVLFERSGEFIARVKFTVLILPNSINRITNFDVPFVKSDYSIQDAKINQILQLSTSISAQPVATEAKKNKKKKKKPQKGKKSTTSAATPATPAVTTTSTTPVTPAVTSTSTSTENPNLPPTNTDTQMNVD